jgi:hypothetical protein
MHITFRSLKHTQSFLVAMRLLSRGTLNVAIIPRSSILHSFRNTNSIIVILHKMLSHL